MTSLRRTVLLLVLPILALTGCTGMDGTGELNYIEQDGSVVQIGEPDRDGAVDVSGTTLDGDPLDLADLRGEVVVVNVWGAWCPPCRIEAPVLVEAAEELDATFVGINIRDDSNDALAFERSAEVPYPSIYDPSSETLLGFGQDVVIRSPPVTLVLDREGRVAAVINGAVPSLTTLRDVVEEVAAEDG